MPPVVGVEDVTETSARKSSITYSPAEMLPAVSVSVIPVSESTEDISYHVVMAVGSVDPKPMRHPAGIPLALQEEPIPVTAVALADAVPVVYSSRDMRNPRTVWVPPGNVSVINPCHANSLVDGVKVYIIILLLVAAVALSARNTQYKSSLNCMAWGYIAGILVPASIGRAMPIGIGPANLSVANGPVRCCINVPSIVLAESYALYAAVGPVNVCSAARFAIIVVEIILLHF
jgi:hypothetical protein